MLSTLTGCPYSLHSSKGRCEAQKDPEIFVIYIGCAPSSPWPCLPSTFRGQDSLCIRFESP